MGYYWLKFTMTFLQGFSAGLIMSSNEIGIEGNHVLGEDFLTDLNVYVSF